MIEQNEDTQKREWLINAIIGVRREVLFRLRALSDSFDREKYTKAQRTAISQEIREVAEMVSEKDSFMERREQIKDIPFENNVKQDSLIGITRAKIKKMLNDIRESILTIEYDREYCVIDRELKEIEQLVEEKDRFIHSKVPGYYAGGKVNPYISKYFNVDDDPEIK